MEVVVRHVRGVGRAVGAHFMGHSPHELFLGKWTPSLSARTPENREAATVTNLPSSPSSTQRPGVAAVIVKRLKAWLEAGHFLPGLGSSTTASPLAAARCTQPDSTALAPAAQCGECQSRTRKAEPAVGSGYRSRLSSG